jgi:ABC-2 type transport system ATP-binding protein
MATPLRLQAEPRIQPHEPRQPAVRVANLTKTYPNGVTALEEVSFDVAAGEVFGLLGPNGAGKTTTVGTLTTQVGPTGRRAEVGGFNVTLSVAAGSSSETLRR